MDKPKELAPKMARLYKKPQMSLLPMDVLQKFVLPAYEEGIIKYKRESWRRGFMVSELVDAAQRHIESFFYSCEDFDPDSFKENGVVKHHLAGAIFSLISILHTLENHPDLDDRRTPESGNPAMEKEDLKRIRSIGYTQFYVEKMSNAVSDRGNEPQLQDKGKNSAHGVPTPY